MPTQQGPSCSSLRNADALKDKDLARIAFQGEGFATKSGSGDKVEALLESLPESLEELSPDDIEIVHAPHFDDNAIKEVVAGAVNDAIEDATSTKSQRDEAALLQDLCERLEEECPDKGGNTHTWAASAGFVLQTSKRCDIKCRLPTGYTFFFWKDVEE
ncbi:unnamed protein product [Amoebophrya sp. A25]|nr:unnamed protein product [Amoebophrya sp. A25]|eukprot:GSA25T00003814001.1